jgi:xanthine dehydrogenase YagS FAD-binding subunit
MNRFTFTSAHSIQEALHENIPGNGTKFIAGGTNLIDLMRADVERPDHLVDIRHLELQTIADTAEGGLRLGALVKNADTAYDERVQSRYPLLAKAILAGASAQLRNMATNGGNLLQRTRCYYFYDTATPCNKREQGSGCSAIQGYNRIHAILGASDQCIAVHPSDMCVALAALEARVIVMNKDGERVIPFADFHRLPGDQPGIDSTLLPGELITHIELPPNGFSDNYQYIKLRDRRSYAFALVSVAVALAMEDNYIKDVRIALGGVAHKPWRNPEAENILKGKIAEELNFRKAADFILQEAKGYKYNEFKIELARRAVVRALTEARDLLAPEPLNCYTYNRHQQL